MDVSISNSRILQKLLLTLPGEILETLRYGSNLCYLDTLSTLALDPRYTSIVFVTHQDVFVEICSRWLQKQHQDGGGDSLAILAALARILPVAPYLSVYAELLLYQRPGILQVFASRTVTALIELPQESLHPLLLALYRLLRFDNEAFATFISPAQLQLLLSHPQQNIKYLTIRIFCLYLHASDLAMEQMLKRYCSEDEIVGEWEDKIIDYAFLTLWEEKRMKQIIQELKNHQNGYQHKESSLPIRRIIVKEDLSQTTACMGNVLVPRLAGEPVDVSSIVNTHTFDHNMRLFGSAINEEKPLLVTGLSGSGKTFLINEFARELGKRQSMISLHLNEQTDIKLLIGMLTTADTPGSFTWRPGILTKAVVEGRWLLIEDLDRAPTEILSALLPLLERQELFVPHWGDTIRAAPGFKMIATIRTNINIRGNETNLGLNILGIRHWTRIPLSMPTNMELAQILTSRFPVLHAHVPKLIKIYSNLTHSRTGQIMDQKARTFKEERIRPQILFRLCKRLKELLLTDGIISGNEPIPEGLNDMIFLEAVDCFAGFSPEGNVKSYIVDFISQELNVHSDRAHFCLEIRSPEYAIGDVGLQIGRTNIPRIKPQRTQNFNQRSKKAPFAITNSVLRVLESVAVAVKMAEPCLLIGETGTGKTTLVQHLADTLGYRLTVVNLSQQSEASDLLGGYKPLNFRAFAVPLKEEFEDLFLRTFSSKRNQHYIDVIGKAVSKSRWSRALALWQEALQIVENNFKIPDNPPGAHLAERQPKRRKLDTFKSQKLKSKWDKFSSNLQNFCMLISGSTRGASLSFIEGNIVKAARNGDWVLLDEINLASPDTIESLADLFCNGIDDAPTLLLSEKGDTERIHAHRDFRIFGAMNPATDIGKRDLAMSLRSRFTEIFIESPDKHLENLILVVKAYLGSYINTNVGIASSVAQLYLKIKQLANENRIVDGSGQKPLFSLRTLTRTLVYVTDLISTYGLRRALYEGFSMTFLTLLNKDSELLLLPLIEKHVLGSSASIRSFLSQPPNSPQDTKKYVQFRHYWVAQGDVAVQKQPHYVITPFVEKNLLKLVRATTTRRFPLLLQGPTSSGKTSMIEYLARISGNKFVRINNHEHTDIQEYLGSYVSGPDGRLEYQEGILVRALREGYWLILDELNLAPTDVLEALNRLLDDNKELFLPETQQVIKPHYNFVLFATQNPPGMYGGRKILSRAFRNRFLELHFADIPEDELKTILQERSQIAPSFCTKIVAVYQQLSILRQKDRLFEQRNSFATLRDLFRWALRDADNREQLAINGFFLLAERVRNPEERLVVKNIIQDVMKVKIDEKTLYGHGSPLLPLAISKMSNQDVVWTGSMRRLCVLVAQALRRNEPVLLIGETGSGKTTICQIVAELLGAKLYAVNAHQNMETGDLIGAQRPVRNRALIETQLTQEISAILTKIGIYEKDSMSNLPTLLEAYEAMLRKGDYSISSELRNHIENLRTRSKALFEWSDGCLVHAMREGQHFLLDEISLADDSVLERLNSVLEPDRTLFLAEKGSTNILVTASQGFQFLATMNPGGDYGKRELSPALRNRFTEIWVPQAIDYDEIREIVAAKISPPFLQYDSPMVAFAMWYSATYNPTAPTVSIRDLLGWIQFINICKSVDPYFALLHGAAMVYIDGLGANPAAKISIPESDIPIKRQECLRKLEILFQHNMISLYNETHNFSFDSDILTLGTFTLKISNPSIQNLKYSLEAPTTKVNAMKLLRALELQKPILLEGSPGVGKTTLVVALAQASGNSLIRINLSDQTDLIDLFGSDVPIEQAEAGNFGWRDAPFLRAMQNGEWVLLDEMNLASQAVLEGLNACFDHRGHIYIPELDQTFVKHPKFTVFAAQNPHHQGGGRKGLPVSFVNRFTIVYADAFTPNDLLIISSQSHPDYSIEKTKSLVSCVTETNFLLQNYCRSETHGGPWEINLRDLLRWGDLLTSRNPIVRSGSAADYQNFLFLQRFRTSEDVAFISQSFKKYLLQGQRAVGSFHNISSSYVQVGFALMAREPLSQPILDQHVKPVAVDLRIAESILFCVQNNWPCLLVGSSGCGKSSLLFQLASKVGADIVNLSLNADMDTMDLIGGYEQVDVQRETISIKKRLKQILHKHTIQKLVSSSEFDIAFMNLEQSVHSSTLEPHEIHNMICKLNNADQIPELLNIADESELLNQRSFQDNRGRFTWTDGILIKALKQGQWLVLDNANLCPSSILDRLNSLLEPNGLLSINERLSSDGNAYVVKPHPSFRLFLTMDPRHGELSRSMRNRCVELFIPVSEQENSFRSTCEPSISRFQMFGSINWSTSDYSHFLMLSSIFFDHLAIADYQLSHRWQGEVFKGLIEVSSSMQENFISNLKVRHKILNSNGVTMQGLRRMYDRISDILGTVSGFGDMQLINPLINSSLISLATRYNLPDLKLHGLYFELLLDVHSFKAKLGSISSGMKLKSVSKMSRLERSYSATESRRVGFESTQPLWRFLEDIAQFVLYFVDGKDFGERGEKENILPFSRQVLSYLQDMTDLAMSQNFNEGTFQAYLTVGRTITAYGSEKFELRCLADELSTRLSTFNDSWRLSTGLSMEILWELLKPHIVKSIAQLEYRLRVEELADRFDALKWTVGASIQELNSFRNSMIHFYSKMDSLKTYNDGPLEDVQKSFEELESRSRSLKDSDMPHFAKQFEIMCQYQAATYPKEPVKPPSILDLLANRPTRCLLGFNDLPSAWASLSQIEGFTGIGNPSTSLATLRSTFPPSVLSAIEKSSNVPLRCLASLREEMNQMAKIVARLSDSISNSHIHVMNTKLTRIFILICEVHIDLLDPLSFENCIARLNRYDHISVVGDSAADAPLLSMKSGESELHHFRLAIDDYFNPALLNLYTALDQSTEPSAATSLAWIQFFTGCLYLYVPDRSFDPALKAIVEQDRYEKRKKELQTKLRALQEFELLFTGQPSSLRCQIVEQQLRDLGIEPQVFTVPRPQASDLSQLQGELNNVLKFVLFRSPNASDLEMLLHGDATKIQELAGLRLNITQSIDRLATRFRFYDDITKPLIAILQGLDTGFALALLTGSPATPQSSIVKRVCESTPFLGMRATYLLSEPFLDFEYHQKQTFDSRILFLKIAALSRSVNYDIGLVATRILSDVFHAFYEDWKAGLQNDQRKDAAKSSLYRYRGAEEDAVAADEEEFLNLFPDYSENSEGFNRTDEPRYEQKALTQLIASHQKAIFKNFNSTSDQILDMLQHSSRNIGSSWPGDSSISKYDMPAESMMCGVVVCLSKQHDQLNGISKTSQESNFYFDSNVVEAQKTVSLVHQIQARFQDLAEAWPEHASIQDVLRTSSELMAMHHSEPIAKLLAKAEQLYGFVHEWQAVASKEYSAVSVYDQLTNLIVGWRRLELSTWARLLDMEVRKCNDDADSWWFIAYEVIIAAPLSAVRSREDLQQYGEQLFSILGDFLVTTSIGQFTQRLQLIECFQMQLELLVKEVPTLKLVQNTLTNFLNYYTRFVKTIHEILEKGRKTLDNDMKEILLLASWKDTNINALKESARQSHHKLFKIVRKFRAFLAQSAEKYIVQGLPERSDNAEIPAHNDFKSRPKDVDQNVFAVCQQHLPNWASKPTRFTNPLSTARNMARMSQMPSIALDSASYLNEYVDDLASNIKLLQKETPLTETKDNLQAIKHLKYRKKKFFADTLKNIRHLGFQSNLNADALARQSSMAKILANCLATPASMPNLEAAEFNFHCLLHQMPQVRQQVRNHSTDLDLRDVTKCTGFLEDILNKVIRQRGTLMDCISDLQIMDKTVSLMQNLRLSETYTISREDRNGLANRREIEKLIAWLPHLLNASINIIEKYDELGGVDSSFVKETLKSRKSRIDSLDETYRSLPELPLGLSSSLKEQTNRQAIDTLADLTANLQDLKNNYPNLSFVLKQIELWTTTDSSSSGEMQRDIPFALMEFDESLSRALDLILVTIQRTQEVFASASISQENSGWLVKTDSMLTHCLRILHPQKINSLLQDTISKIYHLESNGKPSIQVARALCTIAMPIIQQYRNFLQIAFENYAVFHRSISRLARVSAQSFCQVASQGFCSPADNSKADLGKSEKLEEGTGLGEGEGAQDISKDIDNDEDLSELAQDTKKDKEKADIEDQEDAVNMNQEELEGDMGEAPSGEKDGESEGEEEEMDIDEETGSVDDLDPSAVDEKLWDGRNENAKKDKEGSQTKGNRNKSDQVAATTDENETSKNSSAEDSDEICDEGIEEGEQVAHEQAEQLDTHVENENPLELPDSIDLGHDDGSLGGSDINDEDDLLSDDDDISEKKDICESENNSQGDETDNEGPQRDENLQVEEDLVEENQEDAEDKNRAGSPVDTEPEEDEENDEQGLLRDFSKDGNVGRDDDFSTAAQGLSESGNQVNEEKSKGSNADGNADSNDGTLNFEYNKSTSQEGQNGQTAQNSKEMQDQNTQSEKSSTSQVFKKLGDALEKWHKQQREIQAPPEHSENPKSDPAASNLGNQEFEHLGEEEVDTDTQALGAASQDQAHALDEKAYQSQMQDQLPDFIPNEPSIGNLENEDQIMTDSEFQAQQEKHQEQSRTGALIVDNLTQDNLYHESNVGNSEELEKEEEIHELDSSLSTTHLYPLRSSAPRSASEALLLWTHFETITHSLSLILTEQLRLILAPTLATKMRGDFRTGKRLNIKRIIPYIASNYKRDKIWMRRTMPSKRAYQILLAVDDSKSMSESSGSHLAFETLALIAKSLNMLEVGQICIVRFGTDVHVAHGFDEPFSSEAGAAIFQQFSFQQPKTNIKRLLQESNALFHDARNNLARAGARDLWQLQLIISDGVCEDHEGIRQLVRQAQEARIVIVFVIVDAGKGESILDMSQAVFESEERSVGDAGLGPTKLRIKRYLDGFPFPYYLIVGNVKELPDVLATALRQWFAEVVESG